MSSELQLSCPPQKALPRLFRIASTASWCAFGWLVLSFLPHAILAQTPTPVPVLTWRYDLTHSGANTQETELTPANVASSEFGKLFALSVDDHVFAQPLYVPGLTMSDGKVHNVLFVATENDSVYAFDADATATAIWKASLLTSAYGAGSGATPVPQSDVAPSQDIGPNIGITGTPAINAATNTMYVVSNTKESGKYYSRLHAINILTGAEQAGSPATITATAAGTGDGSSGGEVTFNPLWTNQRAALNYYNGYVYIAYSSHGDVSPFHGWVFAYNATTLAQTAAICLSPNDKGASVWGAGAGLPIDTSTGLMFVVTGNGARSTPFASGSDYGESVIAFNIANGLLTPSDAWTAFDDSSLNTHDWDQGSGGLLMLPDQSGTYPHLILTAGKEGRITILNRDSLGGLASGASSNTNAVQDIPLSSITQGQGFWGTAAYWNGTVYDWAGGDDGGTPNVGMAFTLTNGTLTTTPSSETTFTSAFPSPTFSVSSNGTQDGIVWAVKADQFNSGGPAVLFAFNPSDLSDILYASDSKPGDAAGPANKFSVPMVTNGKVYVAAKGEVDVYGLTSTEPVAAAPTISPNGGTFTASQPVTMSTTTPSANIYYTLDGSTPTTLSTEYISAITISSNTTVKAIASAPGYLQSGVTSATFSFSGSGCTAPTSPGINVCSPAQGASVSSPVSINAAATVSGGVYRFELWNGSTKLASVSNSGVMNQSLALAAGSYALKFTAYNTAGTHVYATQNITVTSGTGGGGSFSLSGSSFVITWRGGVIHVPITVTPSGGFEGTVSMGCSVTGPTGAVSVPTCTVTTQPPTITGTSAVNGTIYVQTVSTTTKGAYTAHVTGTSGSLNESTSVSFTVN